jgi:hypothetical protein
MKKKSIIFVVLIILIAGLYYYNNDTRTRIIPGDGDIQQHTCAPGERYVDGQECVKDEVIVDVQKPKKPVDHCADIMGSTFLSIEKYPVGLPVPGSTTSKENLPLKFKSDGVFERLYSDYIEIGTYTCQKNTIQLRYSNRQQPETVTYNSTTKLIVVGNITYKKQ